MQGTWYLEEILLTWFPRFERPQYAEVRAKWASTDSEWENKKTVCDTYGPEHLMRLIGMPLPSPPPPSSLVVGL
jgi:hypothetical protein